MQMDMMDGEASAKSRRRSRGASMGNQSSTNVHILGVLDCLPQKSIVDPSFQADIASEDGDYERQTTRFLTSVLCIEWLSALVSHALRTEQRLPNSRVTINSKDTIRRLFAFHKSSMLEVCRFASQRWTDKPISDCRVKKQSLDMYCRADSSEDESFLPRTAATYNLRISGSGGALVREGIEIEGSRVVLIAELGSNVVAYERCCNAAGIVRVPYRARVDI